MSRKRTPSFPVTKHLQVLALGALCVVTSFSLGVRTAGDIETVAPSEAGGIRLTGDIDNDGAVTAQDVIDILEVAQGYEDATPEQLEADPNGDGHLTVEDAMRILQDLASR
jgi:hypothetical protein